MARDRGDGGSDPGRRGHGGGGPAGGSNGPAAVTGGPSTGRRRVNRDPLPGSLCTSIVPPWASTILRVVGSPNPLPSARVEKNGSKIRARTASVIPTPVSVTSR